MRTKGWNSSYRVACKRGARNECACACGAEQCRSDTVLHTAERDARRDNEEGPEERERERVCVCVYVCVCVGGGGLHARSSTLHVHATACELAQAVFIRVWPGTDNVDFRVGGKQAGERVVDNHFG